MPAGGYTTMEAGTENSEDECLQKLLQEVNQLRRAGNKRCAAKAFKEGINLFTAALELKPDATQLLTNRAFARIMTAEPASADEDCCLALALERRLPNAYRWRAAVRRDCGWLAGAVEDMRMAARMAPTVDKREAALKEVGKLEEWVAVLEESEAMKKAAEECRAREAKAPTLAAEAKAAFKRNLTQRRADMARKTTEEQERRREQQAHRKQAEEDDKEHMRKQQAAKMLDKMRRSRNVEVLSVDPKSGNFMNASGETTDIESYIDSLRLSMARGANGSSSSGSKIPSSTKPVTSAVHGASHTPAAPSHARSSADSSARHTMSAPAALHSGLFPEPNQAPASSAAQSASQSDGNEGHSDAEVTSTYQLSDADHKSSMYKDSGEPVTSNEPALPFYFAHQQPCAAGESSTAPKSATLPDQAAVDAVLQEIVQKERDARLELGVLTALAEADEQPPIASTGTQESAATVPTKEADTLAAVEVEGRTGVKRPREQDQASDQLPRAQKHHIDATAHAYYPSATDPGADAPSGPPVGISPEASSVADGTADGCVSEADTQEYFAAETGGAATPVGTPAVAAPEIAAHESKEEPQPEHEAATDEKCWMTNPEQAETVPATAAAAEDSAVPEEAASEDASWSGNLSKSQKKKAKRKAKLMSATAGEAPKSPSDETAIPSSEADTCSPTGAAAEGRTGSGDMGTCTPNSHSDEAPIPVSEANTGVPIEAATEASTGNGGVKTCTPSKAATDDGAPAADGGDSLTEPLSPDQEGYLLDSSQAPNGNADATATPAVGPSAEAAATSSESPANVANVADITKATCKVEATLQGAASSLEAQKAEQTSASTTVAKQGRSLFSALGGWFGRGGRQGAASEASGSSTEVDILSEATSGLSTPPHEGATSSPASPSCQEGDYPGRDIYMKARAAHRRGNNQWAKDKTKDCTRHYREAVTLCDQALVVNPTLGHAYLIKGACCLHLNRLQEAAEAYASALQHDLEFRNDAAAHAHVDHIVQAAHQEMAGKSPKKEVVMALLDAAVRLSRSPEWACQTSFSQGEACLSFGDEPSAIKIISNIMSDDILCAAFMRSSKITRAQRERVSIKIKDGGNELQNIKAFKDAKYLYTMSIAVNSANTAAYSNRAYMNLKLGLYGEAIEDATFVLDNTDDTKLRDKAHRRRAQACIELCQYKEAHADYQEIKRKRDEDITMIRSLEMTLAGAEQGAPLMLPKDYRWVKDLPRQKPVLDKNGDVMAGRYEALLDFDAEAGCTKEQLLQRLGLSPKTADTSQAAAKTDAPGTSGAASPTCITSGPYASSSEGSSPANAQTSMPANGVAPSEESSTAGQGPPSGGSAATEHGVPSEHEGPTAGQGPPSDSGAVECVVPAAHGDPTAGQGPPSSGGIAGGDDGCGSRRPSSSYYTAEPGSPLSDACFGSPLSEQQEQTAFMPQDGGHRTSSGSSAAVPDPETSPIDTPSDVSIAGDSSDSDSQPSQHPRSHAVPIPLGQPNSSSSSDKVTSNGRSSFHSNGDGDGSQSDPVSAPPSKAEAQERDLLSNLIHRSGGGLFGGELPSRVKVAPSSEAFPTGLPKAASDGPPSSGGGSQSSSRWGACSDRVSWRQSNPTLPSGFLEQGLSGKQASRAEQARTSDEGSVREGLPPRPAPMQRGFFGRPAPGNAIRAEQQSKPQQQPVQGSDSCTYPQPGVYSNDGRCHFKGIPGDYKLLHKAAQHTNAGDKAFMSHDVMGASQAADEAVRLINQVLKLGRTSCEEFVVHIDRAFALKAMVLTHFNRPKDAIYCLNAALKLTKNANTCRELRAFTNICSTRNFLLAVPDMEKLCELPLPYKPQLPLIDRIITLARQEIAAEAQRSAGRAKKAARKSHEGSDMTGFHSFTPTTPSSKHATEKGPKSRHDIIMQIIIWVAQHELQDLHHAPGHGLGRAHAPHMHAHGPHLPAHAPRSFFGGASWGAGHGGL